MNIASKCITRRRCWFENAEGDEELPPWEPAGHGAIATGSINKCHEFVRSPVMMKWIEEGYRLL